MAVKEKAGSASLFSINKAFAGPPPTGKIFLHDFPKVAP
jgi:hypothetical protein